jgi:hypothetical protein
MEIELELKESLYYLKIHIIWQKFFSQVVFFVVSEVVRQKLLGIENLTLRNIENSQFFEYNYFSDDSAEEIPYLKALRKNNLLDYFKRFKVWSNESLKLYLMKYPYINDLTGKIEPIKLAIPDLDSSFLVNPFEIKNMPHYNCFFYSRYSFFKQEVLEKFEKYLDRDYFSIKEVDIPIETLV